MGENLIIIRKNGNRVPIESRHTATKIVSASQNWALNAEDTVQMSVESPFPQHYEIGDQITMFGRDYKLNRLPKVKKTGMHDFQYDLQFEGIQYDLFRVTYDLTIDTTTNKLQDVSGDTLTGNLKIFMDVLVANANRVFPGKWKLGECPETIGDKTLTFGESDNCLSVLQNLCGQFKVEFDIEKNGGVYTINMKERVGQTLPYTFKYGKGNGLYMLQRDNVSSANIVTRLKVYGSTENITMKYRADRLCLPGCNKGQSFIEHPEVVARYGVFEGRKNFDDIKPTHTGKVTSVIADNVLQFVDTTFPFNLEEKEADGKTTKFLIPGSNAKIHFNTGNLAGYEFEVKKYDHATHTFTLLKMTDERGNEFPSKVSPAFQFAKDNEYKILGIAYPPEIERAAEKKLAEEAEKYYQQNSQPKVQYGLSVTKMFLEKLVDAQGQGIVNVFAPGDFIHVIDEDIDVDKAIRIKSFTRNVLDPYEYTLTISDIQTTASITNRVISDLTEIDKVIEINNLKDPTRARANWRSSREVLNMVFDPDGDYYTDKIKPQSIDTMALSVGAKSMQFGVRNTVFQPNFNGNKNVVKYQGGVLTHYTINEEKAMSWVLADGTFTANNDKDAFYIYAKCSRKDTSGTIVFSLLQHKTDEDVNNYYFFIGVLNSVDPELKARAIALTYGFTMVNGRFIKTGRIESADGKTYFDLDNSEIGGRIVFTSNGKEKTLEELGAESLANKEYIANTLPGILTGLEQQIDGKIESWFQVTDPANYWTTPEEKDLHVGDMWYHIQWRRLFFYDSSHVWKPIQDQDAIDAYDAASQAWDTADGKRRVFVDTPYPPYDIGDLWVDGKDLRRCCEPKDASESYNVNDWCLAVTYDNTKTVIDGGLVTSGTIQVAGDNHSILAGMTGQGTTADSVRFWAGAAYENRKTAPYHVLQDGSVVMTKATVEGVIKAISGTIGGFEIAPGRIGVNDTYGTSNYDGLAILSDFIKFSKSQSNVRIWSGIGINVFPSSSGVPCMARFEYEDGYSYGQSAVALFARCRPNYQSTWHIQRAIDYDGNVYGIGRRATFEEGYIGTAYTSIVEDNLSVTHNFLFTGCNVGSLRFDLPTKAMIDKEVGNKVVMFELNIVCDHSMPNAIFITSRDGAKLYGNNGQYIDKWEMQRGESVRLMYYNGGYHFMSYVR